MNLRVVGLQISIGEKLDTNPMVNYTYYRIVHLLITNAFTNVECVSFLPFRLSGGLITSVEPQESGYINVATIQNDA